VERRKEVERNPAFVVGILPYKLLNRDVVIP
jgi:hypothetical protein